MKLSYEEFDPGRLSTYPLASRPSKVKVADFARPVPRDARLSDWMDALPNLLAAADLRAVAAALAAARQREAPIVWGLGAHVVKVGLGPVLADLMTRGYVSAIATNGAGLIHDFEVALSGATSEDVEASLGPGRFGMAHETGLQLNEALAAGVAAGRGLGQAAAAWLAQANPPYGDASIVTQAGRLDVPVTVHVAIGTDVIHMHPAASGASLGEGSLRDFRYFTASVARLANGVYLNCGSAVVLPEVFLKAVALVRHRGVSLDGLTTVSLDFQRHYRPETNVVHRPTVGVGRGYSLVGHHEIMIPLLAALLD
jgi:hypothetical protein